MTEPRQDPVDLIESALAELRHRQRRGRMGPGGQGGPQGGPLGGPFGGPHTRHGMHRGHARFADAIGAARFRMLAQLVEAPASVSDIALAIGVDQPRASRLVADAAHRGLVERSPDPADARRIQVAITPAGRALLDSMRDSRRTAVETALADFSPAERTAFAGMLSRFVDAWPS